jgi:hypothetical protein
MTLSNAERQARHRARIAERLAAIATAAPAPKPKRAPRTTRPTRWTRAVAELAELLDEYEGWLSRIPEAQRDTGTGELLTDLLDLREHVEALEAALLPRGFGRD